jgi:hypothetical protein
MIGAGFKDLGMQVEVEAILADDADSRIAHSFIELRNTLPSAGAPTSTESKGDGTSRAVPRHTVLLSCAAKWRPSLLRSSCPSSSSETGPPQQAPSSDPDRAAPPREKPCR